MVFTSASMWHDMMTMSLPIGEKIIRPIFVYMFLILLLRVFGKRELAQLNPFDLVVLIMLSNTVQNSIIGDDNSVSGGLIGATALCGFNYLVVRYLFNHRRLDQIIEGRASVLIKNGVIQKRAIARELITKSELLTIAHRQGFRRLEEIDHCIIEPGGTFAIQGKEPGVVEKNHSDLVERLERIEKQMAKLLGAQLPDDQLPDDLNKTNKNKHVDAL